MKGVVDTVGMDSSSFKALKISWDIVKSPEFERKM